MIRSKAERILEIGIELGVKENFNSTLASFCIDLYEKLTIEWLDHCIKLWMEYNKIMESMWDWEDLHGVYSVLLDNNLK